MRKLICIAFLFLCASIAQAADITFTWDPMPAGQNWQQVRIYEKMTTTYNKVAEVPGNQTTATVKNVVPGRHEYIARAYDGTWESDDSNSVVTPPIPASPTNIKATITVSITVP